MSKISLNPKDHPLETRYVPKSKVRDLETSKDPDCRLYRVNRALQVASISSDDYHWVTEHLYAHFLGIHFGSGDSVPSPVEYGAGASE